MIEIMLFAFFALALAVLLGIHIGHGHGVEQGKRIGHREAHDWSQRWGDLGK